MEATVLGADLNAISIVDTFESLIWAERYSEAGDFELYLPATTENLLLLMEDRYLTTNESETAMIIEGIQVDSDPENGAHLTVIGRSLESILERRIVWNQTLLYGDIEACTKRLLDENAISPSDESRKIPNLVFRSSEDPEILAVKLQAQFTGDTLYDAIKALCDATGLGFKITLEEGLFVFSLYKGADRSYGQNLRPFVVFSPAYDNISNSNYAESKRQVKTVTLVAGEGEGAERITTVVEAAGGALSGLDRRELYTDARDISSTTGYGETLSDEEYQEQLAERGKEKLAENEISQSFEGKIEDAVNFSYGRDFFMGDIVQIVNEYGQEASVRVTEFIRSQNVNGLEMYPTFTAS